MSGPLSHDPLRTVREALERLECHPTGPDWKMVSRCPAHEDRSPSLSVAEGVDRRALVYCHAGCAAEDVIRALGLEWADLFPPGHRNARPVPLLARNQPRPIDMVLQAAREAGIGHRATTKPDMWAIDRCPCCNRQGSLWVREVERDGRLQVCCLNGGCSPVAVLAALAGLEDPQPATTLTRAAA